MLKIFSPCSLSKKYLLEDEFSGLVFDCYVSYFNFLLCRRSVLERTLASSDVSQEEQITLLKDLERKETQYIRLKRHKICVDDFDLLTIIGRGAFGEVRDVHVTLLSHIC